jgi:hypothetical protein
MRFESCRAPWGSIGSQKGPGAVPRFVLRSVVRRSSVVILRNKFDFEEAWCCDCVAGAGTGVCRVLCGV